MNVAGNFEFFADAFPTDLLPAVFDLILAEWPNSPRPEDTPLENRITNRFVGHLTNAMRRKSYPFKFSYRPKLADAESDSESGEVDICIDSYSRHPDAFFVFECKRLNVQYDSGFNDESATYVGKKGTGCFLSDQYPATCDCGGMIGYVMDGNVPKAVDAINRALGSHRGPLRLHPPHELEPAAITPDRRVHRTRHVGNRHDLVVYHIFLPF